jgi:hypothetical protein
MDTYGHMMPELHDQAVNVLDNIATEISTNNDSKIISLAS